jgi:hypothetical protein
VIADFLTTLDFTDLLALAGLVAFVGLAMLAVVLGAASRPRRRR